MQIQKSAVIIIDHLIFDKKMNIIYNSYLYSNAIKHSLSFQEYFYPPHQSDTTSKEQKLYVYN